MDFHGENYHNKGHQTARNSNEHRGGGGGYQGPQGHLPPHIAPVPPPPAALPAGLEVRRTEGAEVAWMEVLRAHLTDYRLAVDSEVQAKKCALEAQQDLGTKYNIPKLNQRVVEGGQESQVFLCTEEDGVLVMKCTVCSISTTGVKTMESHMNGKKHLARLSGMEVVEGVITSDPAMATASLVPERGLLARLLPLHRGPPLLGTGHLAEVLLGRAEPEYHCLLCSSSHTVRAVVPHLLSAGHQLAHLAQARPELYLQFAARSAPELWGPETFAELDSLVAELEVEWVEPVVVASPLVFEATRAQLLAKMAANTA